jgi:hypothetical protein
VNDFPEKSSHFVWWHMENGMQDVRNGCPVVKTDRFFSPYWVSARFKENIHIGTILDFT